MVDIANIIGYNGIKFLKESIFLLFTVGFLPAENNYPRDVFIKRKV